MTLEPTRRTVARWLLLVLLLIGSGAQFAAVAHADGDPASDVLIVDDVFYPYSPSVAKSLTAKLAGETNAARAAGFTIKVALIASQGDLGAAAVLFGKPQSYARFLEEEIRELAPHKLLLVVMPSGFGVATSTGAAEQAAATLAKPAGGSSDDLAQAAIAALPKLAAAAGRPLKNVHDQQAPSAATATSSSKAPAGAIIALGAIIVAGAIIIVRQRRARRR